MHISTIDSAEITGKKDQDSGRQPAREIFNRLSFDLLCSKTASVRRRQNFVVFRSHCYFIARLYIDFPDGSTDAVTRPVSSAQITCFLRLATI